MELGKNHITIVSTQAMQNLSAPLALLGIDFFSYTRFYFDGTSISLLTHTKWYEFFLKQEVPKSVNVFKLKTGCSLWSEVFPAEANAEARNYFNIDNGINFSYRRDSYVEVISYASNVDSKKNLNYFISILDLLEKFISYFRERAESLIEKAIQHRIIIPQVMRGYSEVESELMLKSETKKLFLEKIGHFEKIKRLSKREHQCLKLIAQGKTFKKSAEILGISPRTIESHIEHMKFKLDCISKSELLDVYWNISRNKLDAFDCWFKETESNQ